MPNVTLVDYALDKMFSHIRTREPDVLFPRDVNDVRVNAKVFACDNGIMGVQFGRGVAYAFDFKQNGTKENYEKMVEKARRIDLPSRGLLNGFIEERLESGIEGDLGFLVTMAKKTRETLAPVDEFYGV